MVQNGSLLPGSNAYVNGELTYSTNNWYTKEYVSNNSMSYSKYIDYIKARKDFKIINNLTEIVTDGLYSITTPVTLTSSQFDGKKVVLIVQATATIDVNFTPTGSVTLLAPMINIDPTVTEIKAILIGAQVATGNSENTPLKIIGEISLTKSQVDDDSYAKGFGQGYSAAVSNVVRDFYTHPRRPMNRNPMLLILLIVLLVLALGGGYGQWDYAGSGAGLVILILLVLLSASCDERCDTPREHATTKPTGGRNLLKTQGLRNPGPGAIGEQAFAEGAGKVRELL